MAPCSVRTTVGALIQRAFAQQYRKLRPQRQSASLLAIPEHVLQNTLCRLALPLGVMFDTSAALPVLYTFVCCCDGVKNFTQFA